MAPSHLLQPLFSGKLQIRKKFHTEWFFLWKTDSQINNVSTNFSFDKFSDKRDTDLNVNDLKRCGSHVSRGTDIITHSNTNLKSDSGNIDVSLWFGWVGGRAGGCQTCGTHISVSARRILPICPIWACPWAKKLPQTGSRLCGTHISETAGWVYSIQCFMDLPRPLIVQCHSYLPICSIRACQLARNLSNQATFGPYLAKPISLKPLDGFIPFEVLWKCLDL